MTESPELLIDPPNQRRSGGVADALGEVLRSVQMTGAVFLEARFTAPWCVISRITAADCRPFMPAAAQIIGYHVVIDGKLVLELDGDDPVEVTGGEIVLLPRNDEHRLASAPGLPGVNAHDLLQPGRSGGLAQISYGGGGGATQLVCGFLASEMCNPLIAALPRWLKIDITQGTSGDWIEASVRFAARELAQGRLASSGVMSRLSELLFVEAVRQYASTLPEEETGRLNGLKDPYVARALGLLHSRMDARWTAESLAREVALSRSAFNDRFTALLGMPPMRYLTLWRLQLAKEALRRRRGSIAQIANSVGYESEVAFNRAFKREFGDPPARWRERQS
jgi:AraC-like DNA-binding protein